MHSLAKLPSSLVLPRVHSSHLPAHTAPSVLEKNTGKSFTDTRNLGIGKATAFRLAQDGASVVINYASDAAAANEVVEKIGGNRAIAVKADAGSVSGVEAMVQATVKHFGKIDILVPNAGILPMIDLKSTSEADFDQIYNLNVKGPYFLVQVRSFFHFFPRQNRILRH